MKSENKIPISDIRSRLSQIINVPYPEEAFDALWYGWKKYCLRHKIHNSSFFSQALKKGWLQRADVDHFWWYIFNQEHY